MLTYTVSEITAIIGAGILQKAEDTPIEYLLLDSRKLLFPATSLFFALDGLHRSGKSFIDELYHKQVRNFVVGNEVSASFIAAYPDANFLAVEDVLVSLQRLSAFHRNRFDIPVIGITGSNGKTIVKEWLNQLLGNTYNIVRSPKSYNSQVGVPLSVWQMNPVHTLGIFEAGISRPGEMQRLQPIIRPNTGIVTFMGEAHAEGFTGMKEKIWEKLQLFRTTKKLIYCADDRLLHETLIEFRTQVNPQLELFCWAKGSPADLPISQVERRTDGSIVHTQLGNTAFHFFIPFTDEASVYNAITCCAVMLSMNIPPSSIPVWMSELKPVEMRLELKQGINQCAIINDSYSADVNSLGIALDFLQQQQQHTKKTVILSDLLQSGLPDEVLCSKIASILRHRKLHRFIGIGPVLSSHARLFDGVGKLDFFESTEAFLSNIHAMQFHDETILLKGARIFQFEKISKLLEQKLHETVLEINLNALRSNLKIYRNLLQKDVKLMVMVKAFSYGSGSFEIASLLQHAGADYLAVAYTDEGVELRKAGIRLPIMVMNTTMAGFDNLLHYQLEPEIYSFQILESFRYYLRQRQITRYPVHIKLDTGMHRLGFVEADIQKLSELLKDDDSFTIKSVFSHLVGSENEAHDAFTAQQAASFTQMADALESATKTPFIRHMANTSAIHRHPGLQMGMVRLGIGLYGVDDRLPLQNVTTLKTTISQLKHIRAGDSVGYSRRGVVSKDAVIATVRIGYADGYSRIFGNGNGKMLVNGELAPVIGNVCMDMTMLDITGIYANEGDEVIVFGEELPVKNLAQWAGTIPYEILTNVSQRVKRVYFEE